jgi:hypothetical protein|tara:strand:+ start:489 stop:713 length:225 start_codon:yes stop_codon:yes gene_type:complete
MTEYLKVKSDVSLVRDMDTNAIVNQNQSEYDKFMSLSKRKYNEKNELDTMKSDLDALKNDMEEIKSLLKSMARN